MLQYLTSKIAFVKKKIRFRNVQQNKTQFFWFPVFLQLLVKQIAHIAKGLKFASFVCLCVKKFLRKFLFILFFSSKKTEKK